MAKASMLHIRLDDETKKLATQALSGMGLSVSEAVRVFLTRVVADQALPFALRTPNAETRAAMAEARQIAGAGQARFATAQGLLNDLENAR